MDLGADDWELGECRIHQIMLEPRIFPQRHTEDRGQREQKWKGGDEGEVRQQRHLIAGLIVAELLYHRNGERHQWMSLLPAIEPAHQALNAIHGSAGDA
jgi:predicted esterase YcpF (UPF0227 family)